MKLMIGTITLILKKKYDNKLHYTTTVSSNVTSVNICSGIGKLTIISAFLIHAVK